MTVQGLAELLSQSTSGYFVTLAVMHYYEEGIEKNWYVCNNTEPVIYEGEEYEPVAFSFTVPDVKEDQITQGQLEIDAVSLSSPTKILVTEKQPRFTIKGLYIGETGNVEKISDSSFLLESASWTLTKLTAKIVLETYLDRYTPMDTVDVENFLGCY